MKELRPVPKPQRIRSKALTNSAKGRACTLRCDVHNGCAPPETTVFCHVRMAGHAGVATKPPDFWGYYGCANCHAMQERHEVASFETLRAICETQYIMAAEGLLAVKGWSPR